MIMDYDFPRRRPPWPHRRPTLSTPLPLHLPRQCLPHIFICRPHGPLASTSTCLPLLSLTISWPSCSYPAERQRLLIYEFPTCFTTPVTTMSACCCCTEEMLVCRCCSCTRPSQTNWDLVPWQRQDTNAHYGALSSFSNCCIKNRLSDEHELFAATICYIT
jgi:hypothetical protein